MYVSETNNECSPVWTYLYPPGCPGVCLWKFLEISGAGRTGHLVTLCQVSNSCFPSSSPATASASPVNMPTFGAPEQLLGLKQAGLETELLRARGSGVSTLSWL